MKILKIDGGDYSADYAALSFENKFGGTPVIDIINNLDKYKCEEDSDDSWGLEVVEVEGEVSQSFIDFVKDEMDYDDTKHVMWFHEMEMITA